MRGLAFTRPLPTTTATTHHHLDTVHQQIKKIYREFFVIYLYVNRLHGDGQHVSFR